MEKVIASPPASTTIPAKPDPKALVILAKSIFRELRSQGYEPAQIVGLASELISLVTTDISSRRA